MGVVVCRRVAEGAPILFVSRERDGGWRFLCGGADHDAEGSDAPQVACLECTVARDPTLNELAGLCLHHYAWRDAADARWQRGDRHEDFIVRAIDEHGWAVQIVPGGDDGPGFAYTVGLFARYRLPELICVGLRGEVMHAMLNECGARMRDRGPPALEVPFDGVLDDYPVLLRAVMSPDSYRRHVGYALWLYAGHNFPLLQLVYPDLAGRFPGEGGVNPALAAQQPLLL